MKGENPRKTGGREKEKEERGKEWGGRDKADQLLSSGKPTTK